MNPHATPERISLFVPGSPDARSALVCCGPFPPPTAEATPDIVHDLTLLTPPGATVLCIGDHGPVATGLAEAGCTVISWHTTIETMVESIETTWEVAASVTHRLGTISDLGQPGALPYENPFDALVILDPHLNSEDLATIRAAVTPDLAPGYVITEKVCTTAVDPTSDIERRWGESTHLEVDLTLCDCGADAYTIIGAHF